MDLKTLRELEPWDWPDDTGKRLAGLLQDRGANGDERLLAAELAGDFILIDDTLVGTLTFTTRPCALPASGPWRQPGLTSLPSSPPRTLTNSCDSPR